MQSQDLENKEKIEAMTDLYNNQIIKEYTKAFESVITITSDHALNEFMSEYTGEQASRAAIIMQKYQVLSQEYQGQSKSFKEKHESVL